MTALPIFLAAALTGYGSGDPLQRHSHHDDGSVGEERQGVQRVDCGKPASILSQQPGQAPAGTRIRAVPPTSIGVHADRTNHIERGRLAGSRSTLYRLSLAVLISGAASDAASSWGRPELNPVLRDSRGRFGTRGLVVKVSVTGAIAAVAHLVSRRHPRAAAAVNFAVGASWHGAAIHNRRLR